MLTKEQRDPVGVVRSEKDNHFEIVVRGEEIPRSSDVRTYWKAQQRSGFAEVAGRTV